MKETIKNFFQELKESPKKAIISFMKTELFLYLLFGFLTTVVNVITFAAFRYYFIKINFEFRFFTKVIKPWAIAEVIAFIVAVLFAFFVDKYIVFKSRTKTIFKELIAFIGARLISQIICMIVMYIMIDINNMNEIYAKFATIVINIVFNYLASKLFIFRKKI